MNAKITVTVPIEKIHLKVHEILEDTANSLELASVDVTSISKNVLTESDFLYQLEQIDLIRKKLALLDANLEDCYNILNGLVIYKTKQNEKEVKMNDASRTNQG